jgi:hypothetical protein
MPETGESRKATALSALAAGNDEIERRPFFLPDLNSAPG